MRSATGRFSRVRTWLCGGCLIAVFLALAPRAHAAPTLVKIGDFVNPTFASGPPGDPSRVFVTEKWGTLRLIRDGVVLERPFLDLTGSVSSTFERGMLSVAFPADYTSSGRFYVFITASAAASTSGEGELQVREYHRSATDPDVADPDSGRILLAIEHHDVSHNGGQLQFGPDGKLWLTTGDGANSAAAQDPTVLLGKIMRLDLSAAAPVPELLAKGLRNPWRFSFDRATGELVVPDVGESAIEEINVGLSANYGWPCFEGSARLMSNTACDVGTAVPVVEKSHQDGYCAIVGGYVVRDPGLPTLLGRYLYGDFCDSAVRSVQLPSGADDAPTGMSVQNLTSFGEDACGRLLATSVQGPVYRIVDGAPSPCPPVSEPPAGPPETPISTNPPPPPHDARACKLSSRFSGLRSVRRARRVSVTLRADESCRATVSGRIRGVASFRAARYQLAAGRRSVVRLRLSASGTRAVRRALKRHSSLAVAIQIKAVDDAGNIRKLARSARVRG